MFNSKFPGWQPNKTALIKIKEKISDDDKLKLFEKAIDYIFSSSSTTKVIIEEIMGFLPSKCEALKKLASHKSYFGPILTRSTNYLLAILYLYEVYSIHRSLISQEFFHEMEHWLKKYIDNCSSVLTKTYINEVILQDNMVTFNSYTYRFYPEINIANLISKFNQSNSLLFTKKVKKLKLTQIYNNHDNRCQGAVRYWLKQKAISNIQSKPYKNKIMLNMVKSLEMKNNNLLNHNVNLQIDTFQKSNFWQSEPLLHWYDIPCSNQSIPQVLIQIINLMQFYKVENLYAEMKTVEHEMGFSLNVRGNGLKISFYDPNNAQLYWKQYIKQDEITDKMFKADLPYMEYFSQNINKKLSILVSCYTLEQVKIIDEVFNYKNICDLANNEADQLLLLSVINDNYNLTELLLKSSICSPNTLYKGYPPIYSAVFNSSINIIKLLLEYGATITYELKNQLLEIAEIKGNYIIKDLILTINTI